MTEQAKLPVYLVVSLASIFIIMLGIKTTATIINPILLAVIITIAVLPLAQKLMRRGMSGKKALVITILVVLGVILALVIMVGGSIYALRLKMPSYAANIASRSQDLSAMLQRAGVISEGISGLDSRGISEQASKAIGVVANTLVQLFMTMLIFVFMLSAAITMPAQWDMDGDVPLVDGIRSFTADVSRYITVTTVINFLVGLGDAIFLMILGVDFAILWGVLAWFLGYIPTVGFWLALIPPTMLAWAEHGATTAFIVFIGFVLINGSVQNFIQPKMMGDNLNISPVIVFLSLFVWGWLLGMMGAILAVPMTLLILVILEQFEVTRGYVRLIRPGAGDEEETLKARAEIGSMWGRFKSGVGFHGGRPAHTPEPPANSGSDDEGSSPPATSSS